MPAINPAETFLSMASASDHVRTQIPYALIGAAGAVGLYLLVA